jgi:hypothetical protein
MMRFKPALTLAAALVSASLLSACETPLPLEAAPPPPPPPPPTHFEQTAPAPFRPADFTWSTAPGPDRIGGHLAYGHGTYSCAGASVALTPETPWVRQRMLSLYGATSGAALPAAQVRARTPQASENYSVFVRIATCDPQSRFTFQGLPNGAWYIITVAHTAGPAKGEDMAIMRRVETYDGTLAIEL